VLAAKVRQRQPGPFDRALPSLIHCASVPIVEGDNVLGRPRQVAHNKAYTRIKFLGMPLDLGHGGGHLRGTSCSARRLEKNWKGRARRGPIVSPLKQDLISCYGNHGQVSGHNQVTRAI
jgi:hypothetical protein